MSDLGWLTLAALLLALALFEARRALDDHPAAPLVAPVGRDVTASDLRPVPPVLAGYSPAERQTITTIWHNDPTDPAPLRPHRVDWQAQIIERRN